MVGLAWEAKVARKSGGACVKWSDMKESPSVQWDRAPCCLEKRKSSQMVAFGEGGWGGEEASWKVL